jgi:hypothetical protein
MTDDSKVNHLTKYEAAKKALAEAYRFDEVKDIRDKAVAMRMYAMQAKDRVLQDYANEIRLRAERRIGEMLCDTELNKGGAEPGVGRRGGKNAVVNGDRILPKLSDLGISKSQSSNWQKLANIPDNDFEELVDRTKQKACDAVDHAKQPKPKPKSKPKPKPEPKPKSKPEPKRKHPGTNSGDPIAACLAEVMPIMRAAIVKMGAEKRLVFFDELRKAVRAIVAEVTALDAETDHWAETAR